MSIRTITIPVLAAFGVALGALPAVAVDPLAGPMPCSVFDPAPCNPSFCGVYDPWPCVPVLPPVGQDLRLSVASRGVGEGHAPQRTINSIADLFAALRGCWQPPPPEAAVPGMEMSVRFSFKRNGEPMAPPRITYVSKDVSEDARRRYRETIDAALQRCTPMPFSDGMGGAIAGRPIAIRFIDNRM